jgi:hypothetical protein
MNSVLLIGAAFCAALALGCLLVVIARATKPKPTIRLAKPLDIEALWEGTLPYERPLTQFAIELNGARKHRQLTKQELADKMGVPVRLITSVEIGNSHTFPFMCRIADALGVKVKIELEEK